MGFAPSQLLEQKKESMAQGLLRPRAVMDIFRYQQEPF
jgi:hypothetical protein